MVDLEALGLAPFKTTIVEIGTRYGSLVVESTARTPGKNRYWAICKCDCGTYPHVARADGVKSGGVRSCGCGTLKAVTKHGLTKSRLYTRWFAMKQRCANKRTAYFRKGITVCERWLSLENFISDMEGSYFEGAQLDRIDNDGNYSPLNCRWVTRIQNMNNTSFNVRITWNGKTQTMSEWAREIGIPPDRLKRRLSQLKWSTERALTTLFVTSDERLRLARAVRSKNRLKSTT